MFACIYVCVYQCKVFSHVCPVNYFLFGSCLFLISFFLLFSLASLALIMFSRELSHRAHRSGVRVYAVDPGINFTDIMTTGWHPLIRKVYSGLAFALPIGRSVQDAATSIVAAVVQAKEDYNPENIHIDCGGMKPLSSTAQSDEDAIKLWNITTHILKTTTSVNRLTSI